MSWPGVASVFSVLPPVFIYLIRLSLPLWSFLCQIHSHLTFCPGNHFDTYHLSLMWYPCWGLLCIVLELTLMCSILIFWLLRDKMHAVVSSDYEGAQKFLLFVFTMSFLCLFMFRCINTYHWVTVACDGHCNSLLPRWERRRHRLGRPRCVHSRIVEVLWCLE